MPSKRIEIIVLACMKRHFACGVGFNSIVALLSGWLIAIVNHWDKSD